MQRLGKSVAARKAARDAIKAENRKLYPFTAEICDALAAEGIAVTVKACREAGKQRGDFTTEAQVCARRWWKWIGPKAERRGYLFSLGSRWFPQSLTSMMVCAAWFVIARRLGHFVNSTRAPLRERPGGLVAVGSWIM
jgi:hypothetical protein